MKILSRNKGKQNGALTAFSAKNRKLFIRKKEKEHLSTDAKEPKKKRSKKWIVFIAALVLIAALLALGMRVYTRRANKTSNQYTYATVERRDITDTLTGSGTLEPADSYTVTTLVSGDILSADFEEGNVVSKGDVLYKLDSADAATSIERAELSVDQSRRNYDEKTEAMASLTVTAPIGGTISDITVKNGSAAGTQNAIAAIEDTSGFTLTEYYSDEYAGKIHTGMTATVSVPDQMLNLTGRVQSVSSQTRTSKTGIVCFAVTVEVANPGSLSAGTDATCWLTDGADTVYPSITDDDGLDAKASTMVYPKVSGTVSELLVRNGETVSAGQAILRLPNDSLSDDVQNASDTVKDAELSLQSQNNSLDKYTVTAPIDGTIIDKYYKQGETSESGKPLCIIYDLASLTLKLNVDELDISQVSVGQVATITADAAPGRTYQGIITKVGINGTTTNGATSYPVSIRIDDTDGLLPGMNVDVSLTVKESKDVLSIPADAVE
jgi:HlyD family secretion protein